MSTPVTHIHAWPAAASLLLASALVAAPPSPQEVGNPQITAPEIVAHVRYLASDELAGRASGTQGSDRAAEYLAARFKAAGLKPAGEGKSYFQSFPVTTGLKLGPGNQFLLTGREPAELKLGEQFMPLSFTRNASVTAPLVFAGYGISQPELKYDDYQGLDVKGKVVVVLRHTPDGDDNGKFGPFALLRYKVLTAREKGAAGILLLSGPVGNHPEDLPNPTLGSSSTDGGMPAAFVKREVVEKLLAPTGQTLEQLQVAMAHGQPNSFAIPGVRVTLQTDVQRQLAQARNVLGLVEGSDPKLKGEVVVVGAHYDHLGMGGEHSLDRSGKPAIHHGADDNASGTAGVLELAHYFAANRKKLGRSVLFMGFSGEEIGLLGSNYWTKNPTIPLAQVTAMVNLDMIGRMANDTVSIIGTGSSPGWKGLLEEVNRTHRLKMGTGGPLKVALGASDQQSFYQKNIPVLFFFTGVHPDYHRPSDTWEKINAAGEAKLLAFAADTVQQLSRLKTRLAFTRSGEEEKSASTGGGFRVYLGTIPDYAAEVEGVMLQGAREGSPAAKAGIQPGDVLVEFDGKKVRNVEEYSAILGGARPNVPIKIVVTRKGQRVTLDLTPLPRN